MEPRHWRNAKVIVPCIAVLGMMCGTVAYSPTLYRMFCAATGYGGTTQRVLNDSATISQQTVTVAFDSSVAPGLPWRFEPVQRAVTVHLGEQQLVFFTAENTGNAPMVAHATFNVTPQSSGIYFNKIQCFCFNEERLEAHEKVKMPVVFYVDPAFGKDPEMRGVSTITLGYTLFRSVNPDKAKDLSRFLVELRTGCGPRPRAICRAVHGLSRARQQQDRADAWRCGRPPLWRRRRLQLFRGAQECRLGLVGGQSRALACRSAGLHSRRQNADPRS